MANKPTIPDFPNLPDFGQMIAQACEIIANVRGIPYDFNGTLSLENKFVVLFKTVKEMFDAQDVLATSYKDLYEFVNTYFSDLNVQAEIDKKLDALVDSGRLDVMLSTLVPYVTPEMFGANGNGTVDDTTAVKRCFSTAIASNKNIVLSKTYKITETITITDKVNVSGGGSILLSGSIDGLVFSAESRVRGCNISNITIDNVKYGNVALTFKNFVNSFLKDITISNCNGIGLKFDGENFESKIDMVSISATQYSKNVGVECNSTDLTFTRLNGLNIETFIKNNATGNFYKDCHAWIYTEAFIATSLFADVNVSCSFDSCIIDTYQTGFKVNGNTTSRFINCNWIVNPTYLNKLTSTTPPIFISYRDTPPARSNVKLIGCYLSMPGTDTPNWFATKPRVFNTDTPCYLFGCYISNCDDNILSDYFYYNSADIQGVQLSAFRANLKLPEIQIKGEFGKQTSTGSILATLPTFLRPTYNVVASGVCRVAGTNSFIPCYYYIDTSGRIYVTYQSSQTCNSFIVDLTFNV